MFVTRLLPDLEPLLSVREVARALGVSAATVYRLVSDGRLPHVRVLNAIRVRRSDIAELTRQHEGP